MSISTAPPTSSSTVLGETAGVVRRFPFSFTQSGTGAVERTIADKLGDHLTAFDKFTSAEKTAILGYDNTVDTTTGIQNLINDAKTRDAIGPAEAVLPAGSYKTTDTLVISKDVILRGEGLDATHIKIVSATAKPAILVEPSVGGYIWGGGVEKLKIDCSSNCDGVKLSASSPSAISQMAFRDIQIRNCRDGLLVVGTAANEVYINTFENLKITGVSRYGLKVETAAYNNFAHIEVTEVGDGAYAYYIEGVGTNLRHLTSDGVCYFDVPFGSLDQLSVEGIYATTTVASSACVALHRIMSARNITLIDVPNAKCNYAITASNPDYVLDSVRLESTGAGVPNYPFAPSAGAYGVVMNWYGAGAFKLEAFVGDDEMQNVKFINCDDITDTCNVGTRNVAALPTASAKFRGATLILKGGAGVADDFYTCMKNAADAYAWVKLN